MKLLKILWRKLFKKKSPIGSLIYINPMGAPTYDPTAGQMVESGPNTYAYEKMVRVQGEVIEPLPEDTPEDIASLMSCAACDHEFSRVIVYPIDPERRQKILDLLFKDATAPPKIVNGIKCYERVYPMYEYAEANVISDDSLNSQSIIYKYDKRKSHQAKPL